MSLALSISILFILLMQSVNEAQFLTLLVILSFPLPAANSSTVIVSLNHHYNHINLILSLKF